jgi:hypothetical protein
VRHLSLTVFIMLLAAPAVAQAPPPTPAEAQEEDGVDLGRLSSRTCAALDAIDVAASDHPKDPTGPASGGAVWGCYFGAFFSMSGAPIAPGIATALATAIGGAVGAYLAGRPFLPVLLWSLPGIGIGAALSAIGLAIVAGGSVALIALGVSMTSGPIIAIVSAAVIAFSLASLLSGPMTLMGVIYAEDQSGGSALDEAAPPMVGRAAQRF